MKTGNKHFGEFDGYPPPTSNTTYTPNQFFDVVLPHSSRGVVRLVAFMMRKALGWCDTDGNPQEPITTISYNTLINKAGIARSMIKKAIDEATEKNFIRCVQKGLPKTDGSRGCPAMYELKWDDSKEYITSNNKFSGFFSGNGNLTYIPNAFFDFTTPNESLAVVKVVGAILRNSIGYQTKYGFRRQQAKMSFSELQRQTSISSRRTLNDAIQHSIANHHIQRVEAGYFDRNAGKRSRAATYSICWEKAEGLSDGSKRIPTKAEQFEKDTGGTVRKGYRYRNKTRNKTYKTTTRAFERFSNS